MRIYDNPNHPHYGPVRRMWIILAQLDLLSEAPDQWDERIAFMIDKNNWPEAKAQRQMLRIIFDGGI